jgi:hypothetical protein
MKAIVCAILGLQLAVLSVHAAAPAAQEKSLDEVARVATIMIDGDVCQHIVTARALEHMLKNDPRDEWQAGDNYDVNNDAFIQTKKTLIRLAMLASYPVNVNLWMPVPGTQDIQLVIFNKYNLSQFAGSEDNLEQSMPPEMQQVLKTGTRLTVTRQPGMLSVLAPVRNSLGDIVGLVEVVASTAPPAQGG